MDKSTEISLLRHMLHEARYAVFFGGAGVSTGSGIPDFRSDSGVYDNDEGHYAMSLACLKTEPDRFFDFFRRVHNPYAEPCGAHIALEQLQSMGLIQSIITQNIDGLHQMAGSDHVIELHGNANNCYCMRCGKAHDPQVLTFGHIPRCEDCGSIVRPDIVLYGESLAGDMLWQAHEQLAWADLLIVGGSSLSVHPASSLVSSFEGEHLVIINQSPTQLDGLAELIIHSDVSDVLEALV